MFEDLSRENNQSNPLFAFLNGENGSEFYARELWEERQKHGEQPELLDEKMPQKSEQLTGESRGKLLGEKALQRSSKDSDPSDASTAVNLPFKLSDTFTKPASAADATEPFHDDPKKQKRFEHFLKEKYEGGLRTKDSGGASYMSECTRAHESIYTVRPCSFCLRSILESLAPDICSPETSWIYRFYDIFTCIWIYYRGLVWCLAYASRLRKTLAGVANLSDLWSFFFRYLISTTAIHWKRRSRRLVSVNIMGFCLLMEDWIGLPKP